jgi:transaldolase/glucose-6-phosphate isomerase
MGLHLGEYEEQVTALIHSLSDAAIPRRIADRDHTVWCEEPRAELTNRLGWLNLPGATAQYLDGISAVTAGIRKDGIQKVLLLGMGGSSLAPEVFSRVFGSKDGYPTLQVLDSTHPDTVSKTAESVDLSKRLFVVSSKSGTTLETLSLCRTFWDQVTRGTAEPGRHFIAITDPGSSLEQLAEDRGFRHVFLAPSDVGGRYSALSVFGIVPAALIGVDVRRLLARADLMARSTDRMTGDGNPGMVLGAALGALAAEGRDKLTFITSPSLASFPDWIEQLVAESTGKDGKGIIPIVGEPILKIDRYSNDRLFVAISVRGDRAEEVSNLATSLATVGHPVIQIDLADPIDLGAEMFRWEFATAVAGSVLKLTPFDQPDVQLAKDLTKRAMAGEDMGGEAGSTIHVTDRQDLSAGIEQLCVANSGDYLAVNAYLAPDSGTTDLLQQIRSRIGAKLGIATTLGYGPRFLHSTGQLHKGGPNSGLFLQFVDSRGQNLPVPETDFTFGALIEAQSRGDHQALVQRGRRVLRVDLGADARGGLEQVLAAVK